MFKYIFLHKLVAMYLREFSVNAKTEPSNMYKFMLACCTPFLDKTLWFARLRALAIANNRMSTDQILRALKAIFPGLTISGGIISPVEQNLKFTNETKQIFAFSVATTGSQTPYANAANYETLTIELNGNNRSEVEAIIPLLFPFWIQLDYDIID